MENARDILSRQINNVGADILENLARNREPVKRSHLEGHEGYPPSRG